MGQHLYRNQPIDKQREAWTKLLRRNAELVKALGPVTAEAERMYIAHEEQAISNSDGLRVEAALEAARAALAAGNN